MSPDDDDDDDDVRKINKFLQGGRQARSLSLSKASVFSEGGNRRRRRFRVFRGPIYVRE